MIEQILYFILTDHFLSNMEINAKVVTIGEDMWIVIERINVPEDTKEAIEKSVFKTGSNQGMAFPLLGDEIEAIRDACNKYLENQ